MEKEVSVSMPERQDCKDFTRRRGSSWNLLNQCNPFRLQLFPNELSTCKINVPCFWDWSCYFLVSKRNDSGDSQSVSVGDLLLFSLIQKITQYVHLICIHGSQWHSALQLTNNNKIFNSWWLKNNEQVSLTKRWHTSFITIYFVKF